MMIDRLYDMPLRLGYWLLLPFIMIYYIFTTKRPQMTFLVTWCGMKITVDPDNMDLSTEQYRQWHELMLKYIQEHPK